MTDPYPLWRDIVDERQFEVSVLSLGDDPLLGRLIVARSHDHAVIYDEPCALAHEPVLTLHTDDVAYVRMRMIEIIDKFNGDGE